MKIMARRAQSPKPGRSHCTAGELAAMLTPKFQTSLFLLSGAEVEVGFSAHPEEGEDALPAKRSILESKYGIFLGSEVESHPSPSVIQHHSNPVGIPTQGEGGWGRCESSEAVSTASHGPNPIIGTESEPTLPGHRAACHPECPRATTHHLHIPKVPP